MTATAPLRPPLPRVPATLRRLRHALPAVVSLGIFVAALEVMRVELRTVSWHVVSRAVLATPLSHLALAVALTALDYLVLTGYDQLAFSYVGRTIPRLRIGVAAFLTYAISHTIGFPMVSGASVRFRFYTRWGVTPEELSRIVLFCWTTFWLGLLALGGMALAVDPPAGSVALVGRGTLMAAGSAMVLAVAAYLAATVVRREPLRVRNFAVPLPSPSVAVRQVLVSAADWTLAGSVLFSLLPAGQVPFLSFAAAFLGAVLLSMASHVPGGVGIFEGLMVLLLRDRVPAAHLLPALLVYRAVYYLLPFTVAVVGLVADEAHQRRADVALAGAWFGRVTERLTPRLLSAFIFIAGVVLLMSGATPAAPGRLHLIGRLFPLGVVEASHFTGSVVGAGLLVLSHGVARRLDAAYYLSSALIVVGMTTSLLKGFDYETAGLLLVVLLVLRRARPAFDRRAAFFEARFSAGWLAWLFGAVGASVWLGFFAFAHVEYAQSLWWQFELQGDASRFLRASVGASVVVLLAGVARLMRPAAHEAAEPTDADLADADRVIASQERVAPCLAHLRDKALLFDADRAGFVMYGVQGRTWLALGDPVATDDRVSGLIRQFLERADDFGGTPAFYEVGTRHLHRYADFGLTFIKLGEEARVDLDAFTLEGGEAQRFRKVMRRIEKEGCTFRIVDPSGVCALVPQLRAVSDDWLSAKAGAEKGFSVGFFDERYLRRFPVAVVERDLRVLAFANVWPGPNNVELSLDMIRHSKDAPKGLMEALILHVIAWGKARGYRWHLLGMAPLSGFDDSPLAPLWQRLGAFLYEYGEAVYSFQGLRAYKEKFNPVWEPRYLAYPGGLGLPRVLADAAALIAGGYRRIFLKE